MSEKEKIEVEGNIDRLRAINANFEKVSANFKVMHSELKNAQDDPKKMMALSLEFVKATEEYTEAAKEFTNTVARVYGNPVDIEKLLSTVRWQTATATAIFTSLGMTCGIYFDNALENWIDEKPPVQNAQPMIMKLSVETGAVDDVDLTQILPNGVVPVEVGAYGPHNPHTGQSMLELLRAGRTVTLPTQGGQMWIDLGPPKSPAILQSQVATTAKCLAPTP